MENRMTKHIITDPRIMPDPSIVRSGDSFFYGKMALGFGLKGDSFIDSNPDLIKAFIRKIQVTFIINAINEKQAEAKKQGKEPLLITDDNFDTIQISDLPPKGKSWAETCEIINSNNHK